MVNRNRGWRRRVGRRRQERRRGAEEERVTFAPKLMLRKRGAVSVRESQGLACPWAADC